MQQIVLQEPGRFTQREAARPEPQPGEALVRVRRIGVCGTDLHAFAGRQPFFEYPRVLGHELAGEIAQIGPNELDLAEGDRCAVEPYLNCGRCVACRQGKSNCCRELRVLGVHIDGGMCETICVPIEKLHRSHTLSLDQLALVETLGIGAHAAWRAAPRPGENVLVIGAGPIGLGVMQALLPTGANVIAMDVSELRLQFCRDQLGIAHALRPDEDTVARLTELCGGELPTLVMDATGNAASMESTFELADHGGRIVLVGLVKGQLRLDDPNFHRRELSLLATRNSTPETFRRLIGRMEAGQLETSLWITHRMDLSEVVDRFATLGEQPDLVKAMVEV